MLKSLLDSFSKNSGQYLSNTLWLIADKVLRQGFSFALSLLIARYLGPSEFGVWNYIIAICALFSTFSSLGIESLVTRDLVAGHNKASEVVGTAFYLKLAGGLSAVIFSITAILLFDAWTPSYLILALITAAPFVAQSLDVADYYFQSKVASKYAVYGRLWSFVICSLLKIYGLWQEAPLIFFVWVTALELILASAFIFVYFKRQTRIELQWNRAIALDFLKQGWPLALSGVVIMLYMRLDQVMIKSMCGEQEVGYYSAAVRLCEVWYFLPMLVVNSIYPGLVKAYNHNQALFERTMRWLYFSFFWMSFSIALVLFAFNQLIIDFLYGKAYQAAAPVLAIYGFSAVATFLGVASSQVLVLANYTRISFYRTAIGLVVNILLNLVLIPKYASAGAAFATLVSYTVSTFSLSIFTKTRSLSWDLFLAFLPPNRSRQQSL